MLDLTPSQTVGPFLHIELPHEGAGEMAPTGAEGTIRIEGRLLDANGDGIDDGLIELWQADPSGHYQHPEDAGPAVVAGTVAAGGLEGFGGFGRLPTGDGGTFSFTTLKPGPVPGPGGTSQAPHIVVGVFGRGILNRLATRIYFPDEDAANAEDPILALVPAERRSTLIAEAIDGGYRFDIRVGSGDDTETVFFDV
ncbi:MAG: protocatechuate 3,4-dioxygenase subunit alpha [Actinomycetota bacterium]|nr:protocatechuate 3,4-dioxygenase subunit alpha [Actinomycetota bacterium]